MNRPRAVVFGGTGEGRELARFLAERGQAVLLCVATGYGRELVEPMESLEVRAGRLDAGEIASLLRAERAALVVDATHPYAVRVSGNILEACELMKSQGQAVERLRVLRPGGRDALRRVPDAAAAAEELARSGERALLTVGSKELEAFTAVPGYRDRLFARVLPDPAVLARCAALGFTGSRLIAMQGPFSRELNAAMLRQTGARCLVTKDSGAAGGVEEKLAAAREVGARVLVIGRPAREEGLPLGEAKRWLRERLGLEEDGTVARGKPTLRVIGAGMGDPSLLTGRARQALREAAVVYAPPRLAGSLSAVAPSIRAAGWRETLRALEEHALNGEDAAVLVSGDAGFFSLSARIEEELGANTSYEIERISGLNTLQSLCARVGQRYEDARVLSLHGRPGSLGRLPGLAAYHRLGLVLAGSGEDVKQALALLAACAIPNLEVTVGEALSLPEERVQTGPPEGLRGPFAGLSALLIHNPAPTDPNRRLRDGDFVRAAASGANVPMSKEAVRDLIVARLAVRPEDAVWDVGAGTGASAAALAFAAREGAVHAVEQRAEALELIRKNRERLGAWNLFAVAGSAPAVLDDLPAPDAVFVGGGGDALPGVLDAALRKNPAARVCVSAVTLETLHLAAEELDRRGFAGVEIECVQLSRAEPVGARRLLRAHNPVYLISGTGPGPETGNRKETP